MRPVLAAALLSLPLLAGLPTGAEAQTVECSTANADGSYTVPSDWALKPSGLAVGTKFRLLFVTSTRRNATATDIATYNTYVQTRAKAGHSAISDSCGDLFKVVGSTSSVDARVNTDSESTDTDALIYWLNGAKAADNYADFYDGNWDSVATRNESGARITDSLYVWTGSNNDGTKHGQAIGGSGHIRVGRLAGSISNGVSPLSQTVRNAPNSFPFYALSPVFTVAAAQTAQAFVSTLGQTTGTGVWTLNFDSAQAFTTGDNSAGYRLTGVDVKLRSISRAGASSRITAAVHADSNGSPGTQVGTLTVPSISTGDDVTYTFAASGQGLDLAANTQYWFLLDVTGGGGDILASTEGIATTDSDGEDAGAASGWSIADNSYSRGWSSSGAWSSDSVVMQLRVNGVANTANTAATGAPTIAGAATQGQTLTANQGTIADADGLPGGSFPSGYTFQWNRGGTAITGATSRTYTLVGDDVGETITVTVSFTDGGGNTESLTSAATAQVDAVTVRFKESAHEVEEGDAATLTLQLSGSLANAETISVSLTAITATGNGVDFDNSAKQVSIPSGTTEKTFDVTTVQDSLVEQDETFRATILSFNLPAGVARGTPHTSDVTILDDDNTAPTGAPTIAGKAAVGETLTANRGTLADADGLPSTTFPEGYAFQWRRGGTDIAGATSRTYTLVAADAGGTITVAVSYTDNYGNTETVVSAATASVDAGTTEHTLTLSLAPGEPSTVDEGDDPVELVIGGTPALGDYTLFVTLGLGGTAAAGADYTLEYEVNPGEWQSVAGAATPRFDMNALPAKLRVTAVDDGAAEGGETITVTLAETPDRFQFGYSCPITPDDPSGCLDEHGVDQSVPPPNTYAVGTASSVSLTIRPSEGPPNAAPTVDNEIPDQSATAGQAFGFTFAANAFSDPDGDALTYTAVKRDGAALPAWLTFAPGARAFSGTPGAGDAGTVSVKVTASDPGGLSAEDTFDIAVTAPPPVTPAAGFASAASSAGEGAGTRNVAVGFSPAPQSAITLAYTVGGTATAGTDFSIANSGSVSVSANATSVNIPVAITDDADEEPNETVVLTLAGGTGYTLGSANVHTLTITDNDDPPPDTPVVSISGGPAVTEGGNAAFTLTASPAPAGNISVRVSVAGGSFAASGARTVTVGASGTASLTVATVDDAADEPDGAVRATVQSGTGYAPHNTNASASVTVLDNDDSGDPGPDPDPDPDPDTGSGGSGGGSVAD
ncbi:MAG: putative Ig domain-containing protein, partial [Gammaproteobacteria bacterium]|nr:putative Ig domain-containing protein [Gammaproteobacteria bacterium]